MQHRASPPSARLIKKSPGQTGTPLRRAETSGGRDDSRSVAFSNGRMSFSSAPIDRRVSTAGEGRPLLCGVSPLETVAYLERAMAQLLFWPVSVSSTTRTAILWEIFTFIHLGHLFILGHIRKSLKNKNKRCITRKYCHPVDQAIHHRKYPVIRDFRVTCNNPSTRLRRRSRQIVVHAKQQVEFLQNSLG